MGGVILPTVSFYLTSATTGDRNGQAPLQSYLKDHLYTVIVVIQPVSNFEKNITR